MNRTAFFAGRSSSLGWAAGPEGREEEREPGRNRDITLVFRDTSDRFECGVEGVVDVIVVVDAVDSPGLVIDDAFKEERGGGGGKGTVVFR